MKCPISAKQKAALERFAAEEAKRLVLANREILIAKARFEAVVEIFEGLGLALPNKPPE